MKITIRNENKKGFTIFLPLAILKSKWIWKLVKSNDQQLDLEKISNDLYYFLKKHRKEIGKLTLIDVQSNDGSKIKIII